MILHGDCLDVLPTLDANSVQCVVTSPPYFGLRSYLDDDDPLKSKEHGLEQRPDCLGWATGDACGVCFICVQVRTFRAVRRVLRKDGTLWVNMGDSFAGSRRGPDTNSTLEGSRKNQAECRKAQTFTASRRRDDAPIPRSDRKLPGFRDKDLMGMPWRLAFALQADGWRLRRDNIWNKVNPMPESAKDRPTTSHEYVFLFSKSRRYYYDAAAISEPVTGGANARVSQNKPSGWDMGPGNHRDNALVGRHNNNGVGWGYADGEAAKPRTRPSEAGAMKGTAESHRMGREPGWRDGVTPKAALNVAGSRQNESFQAATSTELVERRNCRSVWTFPTQPYREAHFATFPEQLAARCILAGSRPGDVVLDPYGGSGTVGQAATNLGREFILIELKADNVKLATQRTITTRGLAL
jgi:DNA modification methylase